MTPHNFTRRDLLTRSLLLGGAVTLGPSVLAGCSRTDPDTGAEAGGDRLTKLKDQGFITVGFAGEVPYGYKDGDKITGQAPEIHKVIWAELGIKEVRAQVADFGALISALNASRFDAIAAGMFITPDRCKQAAFSQPEYVADSAFLVAAGNPKGVSDYKSIAAKGLKLGVMKGAVEQGYAEGNGVASDKLTIFEDQAIAINAVSSGKVDAFGLTRLSLETVLEKQPNAKLEVTDGFIPEVDGKKQYGGGATVFRKGDQDLLKAYNEGLATLKKSGRLLEIMKPFGFTEENIAPDDVTTDTLCKG